MERQVRLSDANNSGLENVKVYYTKEMEGQINYLMTECGKKRIAAEDQGTRIAIFAKSKVQAFADIIKGSYQYEDIPEPKLKGDTLTCRRDHTILGILIRKGDKIMAVCTEKHFRELKFFVFVRQVPNFQVSKIFNSHREMVEYLQNEERIML